jgi:tetratricopeptide (TPR) repeat protein
MINSFVRRFMILAVLTALAGCAAQPAPQPSTAPTPAKTEASAEAEAIYSYLSYRELVQEQKPDQAAQALEKAIAIQPSPELYLELGNLYWRTSRFADALMALKQGLDKYPDSELLQSTLAKTYAAQGRFDDAVMTLDDYRKKRPDQIEPIHEIALYLMEQGRFGEAVDRLNAIPDKNATPTTDFLLGKGYFGLELFDKAIAAFQKAVAADPEYFDAWIEMGLTYEAQKNIIDAERVFAQLFESGLDNQQVVFRLVDLNLKLNNPDKALSYVQQYPEDQALTLEAANLFLTQGFHDHAAELLDPMAREHPIPESARFYLAILEYEGRDDAEKALKHLEAIPENHPHYERSLIFRIHLLYQKNDHDGARKLAQASMLRFPRQPEFRIIVAEIHEREKEYSQALDILLKASTMWPENTTILYRTGLIYDRMNHRDQAMSVMEKIIAKNPEHDDALNFLGYALAEQGQDLKRAEVLIQTALKIKPDNGFFIDSLAWVYFKQGKTRQAWQEIRRAVRLADDDPVIWEHYGDIARAMNLPNEARKGYTKSLEYAGENADAVRAKLNALGGPR